MTVSGCLVARQASAPRAGAMPTYQGRAPMSLFAPVDTFDTSTFLRAVVQPGGSSTVEHFLLPVTGLENNGQPVTPKGFGSLYGLFLTIDATLAANSFTSLNVTLWADPKNDARQPGRQRDQRSRLRQRNGKRHRPGHRHHGVGVIEPRSGNRDPPREFRGKHHTDPGRERAVAWVDPARDPAPRATDHAADRVPIAALRRTEPRSTR